MYGARTIFRQILLLAFLTIITNVSYIFFRLIPCLRPRFGCPRPSSGFRFPVRPHVLRLRPTVFDFRHVPRYSKRYVRSEVFFVGACSIHLYPMAANTAGKSKSLSAVYTWHGSKDGPGLLLLVLG